VLIAFYSVIFILLLIARSKLVLDFALTVHFIHLIVTSLYTHAIPANLFWWALQLCSATIMASLGVWACQWRELRPINFGSKTPAQQAAATEDEGGESRGRGRGRGGDGAGEYEMVSMSQGDNNA
jgi:ABC-type nickel/cobalt efflux system permease component RcnA